MPSLINETGPERHSAAVPPRGVSITRHLLDRTQCAWGLCHPEKKNKKNNIQGSQGGESHLSQAAAYGPTRAHLAADSGKTVTLAKHVRAPRWEFLSWLCHMGLPSSHSEGTLQGSGSPSRSPRYSSAKWAGNASVAGLLRAKGAHGQPRASQEVRTPGRTRPYRGVLPLTQLLLPWKPCVVHPQQLETPGADKEKQVLGQMPHLQYLISAREEPSVSPTRT